MIGLIALDLVLRIVLASVVSITFVIQIFGVHFHNPATDTAGLQVPDYAIPSFHRCGHSCFAVASAILMILELSDPYSGLFRMRDDVFEAITGAVGNR
jgi:hypothetical protein